MDWMRRRIGRVRKGLAAQGLDGLLVSDLFNIRWLTGFSGSNGLLLITRRRLLLLTDFRYKTQAAQEVKSCPVRIWDRRLLDGLGSHKEMAGVKSLGFESARFSYDDYRRLRRELKGVKLVPTDDPVARLRSVKNPVELSKIAQAARITTQVFREVLSLLKPGVSERDLAVEIDYRLRRASDGPAFPTIVAFGKNSALPHYQPGRHRLHNGEFLLFDFGAVWEGYASDFTRTLVLGRASSGQREVYRVVSEAQRRARDGVRAGRECARVDRLARDHIEKGGYGGYFGHGLGHGVGLSVHELPTLSPRSRDRLEAGMVVTVEPGVYLPDLGGVRIEDLVVVEPRGCRVLTRASRRLIEL